MKVLLFDQQHDVSISPESVPPLVKEVLHLEKHRTDELSVYIVTVEEICRLHQEFFNDPSQTDCISFPLDSQEDTTYHILGEVFVCPKTAVEYLLSQSEEPEFDFETPENQRDFFSESSFDEEGGSQSATFESSNELSGEEDPDCQAFQNRTQVQEVSDDVYAECSLYLVHGILHLLGYDDLEEGSRQKMRQAEQRHMEHLIHKKLLLKGA